MSTVEVVAAAIVRDGCVLAARRVRPERLAGGWEFPGGKVEDGESETAALVRECREELGVDVEVGARLGVGIDGDVRLVLFAATVTAGEPEPLEDHDLLRWLARDALGSVPWLPVDEALLRPVAELLAGEIRTGR